MMYEQVGRSSGRSAPVRLAHVVFITSQPESMRNWYCKVLGAHVVFEDKGLCFMTFDEEHHRVALLAANALLEPASNRNARMHHTAYSFPSLDRLLERYDTLAAEQILPHVAVQHGMTTSIYYRDPDGNFVELQVDNFQSADLATEYMYGPEFQADPVGVAFDPSRMRDELLRGAPVQRLMTRTWAVESNPELPHPFAALVGAPA